MKANSDGAENTVSEDGRTKRLHRTERIVGSSVVAVLGASFGYKFGGTKLDTVAGAFPTMSLIGEFLTGVAVPSVAGALLSAIFLRSYAVAHEHHGARKYVGRPIVAGYRGIAARMRARNPR